MSRKRRTGLKNSEKTQAHEQKKIITHLANHPFSKRTKVRTGKKDKFDKLSAELTKTLYTEPNIYHEDDEDELRKKENEKIKNVGETLKKMDDLDRDKTTLKIMLK